HVLREILARHNRKAPDQDTANAQWLDWLNLGGENQRLESALAWLSGRNQPGAGARLSAALDDLARQYLASGGMADPEELGVYLFGDNGMRGVRSDERYDVRH